MLNIVKDNARTPVTGPVSRSSVLDRVQAFLPTMAAANVELSERQRAEGEACCDIENTEGAHGQLIEMNLAMFEREEDSSDESSDTDSDASTCSCEELNCACSPPPAHGAVTTDNLRMPRKTNASHKRRSGEKNKSLIEEMEQGSRTEKTGGGKTEVDKTKSTLIEEVDAVTGQKCEDSDSDINESIPTVNKNSGASAGSGSIGHQQDISNS